MLVQWQKQRCLSDWQADPREAVVLPLALMYCFVPGGEIFCCALSTQPCVVLQITCGMGIICPDLKQQAWWGCLLEGPTKSHWVLYSQDRNRGFCRQDVILKELSETEEANCPWCCLLSSRVLTKWQHQRCVCSSYKWEKANSAATWVHLM